MKPGVSSLNPYAAAYVPLAKRDGNDKADAPGSPVWYSPSGPVSAHGSYTSSSQNPRRYVQKQQLVDEEHEMDLEYMRIMFPGISYESLNDVYLANSGDLNASIDMLEQLECGTVENLPDSLDIGDVPESAISTESSSVKLKNVVGEASTSSASPAATESVTVA